MVPEGLSGTEIVVNFKSCKEDSGHPVGSPKRAPAVPRVANLVTQLQSNALPSRCRSRFLPWLADQRGPGFLMEAEDIRLNQNSGAARSSATSLEVARSHSGKCRECGVAGGRAR